MSTISSWKAIGDLAEAFNDALNYRSRSEKDLFNKIFLRTDELQRCLAPATYYLMGEKGSGKTAYAVFLENNVIDGVRCQVTTMTETQYRRFIELKRAGKLAYSDYSNIWRSMLLFLVGRLLVVKSKSLIHSITGKFKKIEAEVEKWSRNALNPEIESAFEAVMSQSFSVSAGKKDVAQGAISRNSGSEESAPQIRHYLLETENSLKEAIASLKFPKGHILFIDGIDFRPEHVAYKDYLECIKGLAEAVWQLNTEYFNSIRDSKGRIKIVLLVRPDVFHSLNLYNSNSRLHDNTVFLDWSTNEKEYGQSKLYELSGRYFSVQQATRCEPAEAWENYLEEPGTDNATIKRLLRATFQKPRDILTYIKFARELAARDGGDRESHFPYDLHNRPAMTRKFADYLLGETRNYSAFYMTPSDFQHYLKFFQYLDGKARFTFAEFSSAFVQFSAWARGEEIRATDFIRDPESLLQFFYDTNIIGYSEETQAQGGSHYHWSFRERSLNDIAPKVKSSGLLVVNSGIAKALDIGKAFRKPIGAGLGAKGLVERKAPKRRGGRGGRKRT